MPPTDAPLLEVTDLAFSYAGLAAVRGVSCLLGAGEIVALLEANGAVKSTTVQVIAGALPPLRLQELFRLIAEVAATGVSIILVDQNVHQSLQIAARGYVMEKGQVVPEGSGADLLGNGFVQRAFLGR